MQVHDRGTMKWVSLMLPEHVELLQEVFTEQKEKPLLDEQKRMEIDQKLKHGMKYQLRMEVIYYRNGGIHSLSSKIKRVDQWRKCVVPAETDNHSISLDDVIDIEVEGA